MSAATSRRRGSLVDVLVGDTGSINSRPASSVSAAAIRFGLDLNDRDVAEALTSLAYVGRHGWVAFETHNDEDGVRHFIRAPRPVLAQLAAQIHALLPTTSIESVQTSGLAGSTGAVRMVSSRRHTLFRVSDQRYASTRILASLAEPLRRGERLVLRVVLRPIVSSVLPSEAANPLWKRNRVARHHRAHLQAKYDGPCLSAEITVFARSGSDERTKQILRPVAQALKACQGEAGRLRLRRASARRIESLPPARSWLRGGSITVSPTEAVALLAWPLGSPQLEGLRLGVAPSMPVPRDVSASGRQFAISNAGKTSGRPIAQPVRGALQHTAIVGPTGSGKSTLVANLIRQDIHDGRGVLVVDAKGDLIDDILSHVPQSRLRDVIVLDPSSDLPQPGLRLMPPGVDFDLSADHVVATLQELFKSSWGVRSSQYFRLGLVSLGNWRGATLLDLPRLFHDRSFRERVLATVEDAHTIAAWQRFESLSRAEQAQHVASPLTKLEELVGRRKLRNVLGQRSPRLHFGEVLARRRIVLVRLSAGQLGAPSARLLAGILLWQFFSAVEARSALPKSKRTPYLAYIDELAAFSGLPLPVDGLLERARGLGVGLTLSPQALSQLDRDVQSAVLANVGTFVTFKPISDHEAKVAASTLTGIDSQQLRHLGRFEVAMRLSLGPGHVSTTVTGKTVDMAVKPMSDPDLVRQEAARNFGGTADDLGVDTGDAGVADRHSNRRRRAK